MEVSFHGKVPCGEVLEVLLKGLLEPFPEDRLSAEKVRKAEKREERVPVREEKELGILVTHH